LNHYFTNKPNLGSNEKDIYFKIKEKEFHFITDNGVFSKSGLDFGSRLLIETVLDISTTSVLDLGCGYGPIGTIYKIFNPNSNVTLSDINERAIELAKKNVKANNVDADIIISDGYDNINRSFSLIISNPPVRAGKELLQKLLRDSWAHLEHDGKLIFVIHKQLGGESARRFCADFYNKVEIIHKKAGYLIILCIK